MNFPLVKNWSGWAEVSQTKWRRSDGAAVRWDNGPNTMNWVAYKPDPSDEYLERPCGKRKFFIGPRRWKTAEAAMNALDREFPLPPNAKTQERPDRN